MQMKKIPRKKKKNGVVPSALAGRRWRNITPQDPFVLLGSEEGGFVCLEEVDGDGEDSFTQTEPLVEENEDEAEAEAEVKQRRRKRERESEVEDGNKKKKKKKQKLKEEKEKKGKKQKEKEKEKWKEKEDRRSEMISIANEESGDGVDNGETHFEKDGNGKVLEAAEKKETTIDLSAWADLKLHKELENALADLGFTSPTPIQRACVPEAAHNGKDVVGAAETGSGKTLAYALPILEQLLKEKKSLSCATEVDSNTSLSKKGSPLRVLIITPTRELALQVCDHFQAAAKYTGIKVLSIVGGISSQKQQRLLARGPHVVVGTPGRLWELMSAGENHLLKLQYLSFFVLDEADRLIEKGHFQELHSIMNLLPSQRKRKREENTEDTEGDVFSPGGASGEKSSGGTIVRRRQTFIFSATLALPVGFRKKLKKRTLETGSSFMNTCGSIAALCQRAGLQHNALIVDLTSKAVVANRLEECKIDCREEEKDAYLYYILKIHGCGRTMIFCTSVAAVRHVSALLKILQIPSWPLHAQMQQKQRLKAFDRFRTSKDGVLIATDVAARGIDVEGVRTVIHYQLPHSAEVYVHRSGRTARAFSDGCSILLVSASDKPKYSVLCHTLKKVAGMPSFPINGSYMPAIHKRTQLADKIDILLHHGTQEKAQNNWLKRNAEALGIEVESDDDNTEGNAKQFEEKKQSLQAKRLKQELQELLEKPLEPCSLSHRYATGVGISPLVAKQLQDYASSKTKPGKSKSKSGWGGKFKKAREIVDLSKGRSKLVVIGQETVEPLAALRTSVFTSNA